ncbi:acetyl-CoA carboxylase biotin carboxyl carrier protein [Candidatus Providencia siddallii]|uniref:Biotin carboxyl carrier protein of acetyl-CoA carboxylase n=1 Tax=Candidatus Providencia siddallii TaxID=1715285 RepID=A0ABM9NPF0_9GAMM
MNIRKIKKIIELIEKSNISELEICEGEESLRINRDLSLNKTTHKQYCLTTNSSEHNITNKNINLEKNTNQTVLSTEHKVLSPIVGTFYRALNPKAKPFVEIGQKVTIGDPICIIEAMKMMNQIEADKTGTIKAILLQNGDTVEFNEPLIIIE